jgi:hypothetical protein
MVLIKIFLACSNREGCTSCAFIELETSSKKITEFTFCWIFISSFPPKKSTIAKIKKTKANKYKTGKNLEN